MTSAQSTFEFCPNTEKKPFILLVGTIYIYLISKTYQDNDIQMIKNVLIYSTKTLFTMLVTFSEFMYCDQKLLFNKKNTGMIKSVSLDANIT